VTLRSTTVAALIAGWCVGVLGGAAVARAQADDVAAIRDLFNRYKTALLTGDGATAARLVDT
jgi:hypothetical protein